MYRLRHDSGTQPSQQLQNIGPVSITVVQEHMSWSSQYSRGCRCNCLTSSRKKFFVCTLRHHKIMLRQKISRVNFIFLHLKSSKKSLYLFHCENQQHSYINVNSLYYSIPCANDLKCNFLHCHLLNGVLFLFIHLHRNLFHSPLKHHPCRSKLRLCLFWAFQRLCTLILKKNVYDSIVQT